MQQKQALRNASFKSVSARKAICMPNLKTPDSFYFSDSVNLWLTKATSYLGVMRNHDEPDKMQLAAIQAIAYSSVMQAELAQIAHQQRNEIINLLTFLADAIDQNRRDSRPTNHSDNSQVEMTERRHEEVISLLSRLVELAEQNTNL